MKFEDQIVQAVKNRMIKQITEVNILERWQHGNGFKIPEDIIKKAWDSIDWKEVIDTISPQLQNKICKAIVDNMMTETKTDVKKLMAIEGMREKIRMEAYPKIKEVIGL